MGYNGNRFDLSHLNLSGMNPMVQPVNGTVGMNGHGMHMNGHMNMNGGMNINGGMSPPMMSIPPTMMRPNSN